MTTSNARLRGITWDAPRGVWPLEGTVGLVHERLGVDVSWDRRSLWSFGEEPFADYAREYDLLVIDHPLVGYGIEHELILPFGEVDREAAGIDAVGRSTESYALDGLVWALPVDAAAQVCAWRPDLLAAVPRSWSELFDLARGSKQVIAALTPVNVLCLTFAIIANAGSEPLRGGIDREDYAAALEVLAELASLVPGWCFDTNPIAVLDLLSSSNEWTLAAPLFGYSNYQRPGFREHLLRFGDYLEGADGAGARGSTLGGTGIAVSSHSSDPVLAGQVARLLTDPGVQATTYVTAGGQPAARAAWTGDLANDLTGGYFRDTIATLDGAYVRPNWSGMERFQPAAGELLHQHLRERTDRGAAVDRLRRLFDETVSAPSLDGA